MSHIFLNYHIFIIENLPDKMACPQYPKNLPDEMAWPQCPKNLSDEMAWPRCPNFHI